MKRFLFFPLLLLILVSGFMVTSTATAQAAMTSKCITPGTTNTQHGMVGGANYTISVPANWNGTLVLYSHGYVFSTSPLLNPAPDVGDVTTASALLQQGYALAGSSYSSNGWALQQAFHDQIALLDFFNQTCGHPTRTIAWGHSLGGIITAGLIQLFPERFSGALPMCGVLAGGVGTWNQALDGAFAFNVLLAQSSLPIVHITNANGAFQQAENILAAAQQTPEGRARTALISAVSDTPGWFDRTLPEPAANDFIAQEQNQFLWQSKVDFAFAFGARAELEMRAGGNPSWNTGVDYRRQLERSADRKEVEALYEQAGLNLNHDLDMLEDAPRIVADPQAKAYLSQFVTFNGELDMPVLSMHTTGDGLVVNQDEQAYSSAVRQGDDADMLRQIFVHRAGHCTFTPAETVAAFQTLVHRIDHGTWGNGTDPNQLNQEATNLGSTFNVVPPAFIRFRPTVFLRPFNADSDE